MFNPGFMSEPRRPLQPLIAERQRNLIAQTVSPRHPLFQPQMPPIDQRMPCCLHQGYNLFPCQPIYLISSNQLDALPQRHEQLSKPPPTPPNHENDNVTTFCRSAPRKNSQTALSLAQMPLSNATSISISTTTDDSSPQCLSITSNTSVGAFAAQQLAKRCWSIVQGHRVPISRLETRSQSMVLVFFIIYSQVVSMQWSLE
ncbi:hypothetical protein Ciccas_009314 [Cichlidogyrus casuarinus]|uniref:Uncharacterized protein n=1 Tax=Cichlidogyrus casuarinus TaxID=1844966 RepID=A0ABD2PYT6_9PLAT